MWPAWLQSADSVHAARPASPMRIMGWNPGTEMIEALAGVQMLVQSHLLLLVQLQKDCGLTIAQYGLLSGYASVPLSFPGCAVLIDLEAHQST